MSFCVDTGKISAFGLHACKGLEMQHFSLLDAVACCTQVLMVDPVIAADGYTYERAAIQCVLQKSATSPVTGCTLPHKQIMPNVALRKTILNFASC